MEQVVQVEIDVPLPAALADAGRTVQSVLETQPRFVFRTTRRDNLRFVDTTADVPAPIVVAGSAQEVLDRGTPSDTAPALPPVTDSWESPPPLRSLVITSGRQGEEYVVSAPLELKNKDYVRRLLEITSEGICAAVARIMNKKSSFDIFYMLKDILKSRGVFAAALGVSAAQFAVFFSAATRLQRARNQLMHMNFLGPSNAASAIVTMELFATAFRILGEFAAYTEAQQQPNNQARVGVQTLVRLRMQFDWHMKWNRARFHDEGAEQGGGGGGGDGQQNPLPYDDEDAVDDVADLIPALMI
ncbi:hypothetical protein B484DRAFT_446222 [Ochromonadaceae sp. CCMP2298]|nr:hypothetical protein B484DRAFT_446222 [Ochromonadaceae sp. CCMP2298]